MSDVSLLYGVAATWLESSLEIHQAGFLSSQQKGKAVEAAQIFLGDIVFFVLLASFRWLVHSA